MDLRRRILAFGAVFFSTFLLAGAQSIPVAAADPDLIESGVPTFSVLGPEALGLSSAPVDLQQLPDGRLLAVGHQELAVGDGVRWEVFRQADGDQRVDTLSVAVDRDGQIYAGVPGGFARIDFDPDSRWRFTLIEKLPAKQTPGTPPLVNVSAAGNEWLWWWGSGPLYSWRPGSPSRMVGRANAPERAFLLDGKIHLSDFATGELFRMEKGLLQADPPQGELPAKQTITSVVNFGDGGALVGTRANGVQHYESTRFNPLVHSGLLAGGRRINDLCATDGNFFAAAVDNVGIVFFDHRGRTIQVLDRSIDHRLARAKRLLSTPGGMVWALLAEGIARIEFPDRFSHFEPIVSTSLENTQPHRHQGKLWLLSDMLAHRGIYGEGNRLERFEIDTPPGIIVCLAELDGSLLACGTENIFIRTALETWQVIVTGLRDAHICADQVAPGVWLYLAENEIGFLKKTGDSFTIERHPEPSLGHVYGGIVDGHGVYWAELGVAKIARIDATLARPTVEIFGPNEGLPDGWADLFCLDGDVRLNGSGQIMVLDDATRRFIPDLKLLQAVPALAGAIGRPTRDANGNLWITNQGGVHRYTFHDGRIEESSDFMSEGMLPTHFSMQSDGVVWLHERMRLARYDPSIPVALAAPLRALITGIQFPNTNRELHPVGNRLAPLTASENSFVVHFVAPNNSIRQPVTFEVMLEGAGNEWVSTGGTGSAVFNRLKEGAYVLHVRPRSRDSLGSEVTLAFSILPPWFRSPLAYFIYALSALGFIAFTAWLLTYLQRRETDRLERIVTQRTTELKESNLLLANQVDEIRMLSQAIAQSPVAVILTKPDGQIVFANPRATDLTGYALNELIGKNTRALRSEMIFPELLDEITATVQRGESWQGQLANRRKNDITAHVRTTISPIRSPDRQIRFHLILEEDISEWLADQERRQRLEAQLFQSQKLESVGTLAGGIAHDFNNILTGILGYCELASFDAEKNSPLMSQLTEIRRAGLRAKDLVTQILTFSRRGVTNLVPLDLALPVAEALRLIRASTPATIAISSQLESGIARADSTQIQQVVLNLCTNAIHAIGDKPGRISVSLQLIQIHPHLAAEIRDLKSGPCLRLIVADTGHGMPQSTIDRIFDPFFTTKEQGQGTGLGLSIVQGILASHHGAVRVTSEPDRGTTFELYFPLSTDSATPPAAIGPAPRGEQQEILVVDDEPSVAAFLTARLQQLGYQVLTFSDPREALAAYRAAPSRFQAIVTDLTMPHLTGVDLIQKTRTLGRITPAVIITGYGRDAGGAKLAALPRCEVLQKPFSGDDLARVLHEVMARNSS